MEVRKIMDSGGESGPSRRVNVHREVKKFRIYYLWLYAFSGSFFPFQSLYLQNRGFSKLEIGLILGLTQLLGSLAIIIWGKVADRSDNKKQVLLGLIFAAFLTSGIAGGLSGGALIIILGLLAILRTPLFSLSDCIALEMVPKHYGTMRVGAPIGYAIAVTSAGFLLQEYSMAIFFPLQALIHLCGFLSAKKLNYIPSSPARAEGQGVGWLFKNKSLNIFFVYAAISYASIGFYSSFYSLLMGELGYAQGMVGISYQVAVLAELPFLFWAGYFTRKYSLRGLIGISGFLLAVRWLLVGSGVPAIVLVSQLLHGVSYIVLYYAAVLWLDSIAGPLNKASAQGFHALLSSGSKIVGTSLGGWFAQKWGISRVFLFLGLIVMIATIIWRLWDLNYLQTKGVASSK